MTELLDQALQAIENDRRSAIKPVAHIEALVRRRHTRRRTTVGALAAILAAAATFGVITNGRDGRTASPADNRFEEILLSSSVLVPTVVPQGLRFDGLAAQGGVSQTTDPGMRQLVLADTTDPNKFLRVEVTPGGGTAAEWTALTKQMLQTTIGGAQSAAYGMVDSGVVGMNWIKNGDWFNSTSYGISLEDLHTWAGSLALATDGSLTNGAPIPGLTVVRRGEVAAEQPRVSQDWRTERADGPWLDVRVLGNARWSGPSLRLGKGEPVEIGAVKTLYYEAPSQRTVAWLDPSGTQYEVASNGLSREELIAVVDGLVPLDADRWHALRSSVGPNAISNQVTPMPSQLGEPTAGPTTAAPSPRPSAGFADTGIRASQVTLGHGATTDAVGVFHTNDDRWIGVSKDIEPGGGSDGCQVVAEVAADGALTAWNAPCTGGRYAPDGGCINDQCVVGLRTFETRVVDDRVEMDPDRFHVGVPRGQAP